MYLGFNVSQLNPFGIEKVMCKSVTKNYLFHKTYSILT